MKKLLLLLVAACFIIVANAQKATEAVNMNQEKLLFDIDSEYQRTVPPFIINYSNAARTSVKGVDTNFVGRAHSQRSFRREDCKVISYNKDLDLISITFILDQETYPTIALSDGSVATFYSADHGQTWEGPVLLSDLSDQTPPLRNYYLSGVLYNPTGNVDIENAYGVYQGVAPDDDGGLGDWNNAAFGTSTLGGANYYTEYFTNEEPDEIYDGYFNQFGLTQKGDIMKCFNIWPQSAVWPDWTALKMEDRQGTFNGAGIDWDLQHSVIEVEDWDFPIMTNGRVMWAGIYVFSDLGADMVWSDDAMIGYAWMTGLTEQNDETGVQPILFRTTDGGDEWEYIELEFQDEEWQDFFRNDAEEPIDWLIFPCRDRLLEFTDYTIPYFKSTAGAVDSDGNLQLFADVSSHYYDIINEYSRDALDTVLSPFAFAGNMFKFTISDEIIDITFVDSLMSNPAMDANTANDSLYCGTNGWLRRLQLSKDERSEEFFVTWTDTPTGQRTNPNYLPDLKGWSYNSTTGTHTDAHCFTCGTLEYEYYWYVQTAENAYYTSADSTFTVPMVKAIDIVDWYSNTSASADPVTVQYVDSVTFDAIVPIIHVGIDDTPKGNNVLSVSQNYPNPFDNTSIVKVELQEASELTLQIYNLMGQIVYEYNAGHVFAGTHQLTIEAGNLTEGVYFYTVKAGENSVTQKMIVE